MGKRVLLGASYSVIEPLGLLHLGGLARDMGWERRFNLVEDHNFENFFKEVEDFKPDVVGFNVYTGNHTQLFEAFKRLKKDHPNTQTILGGPHATYFPVESKKHADYVIMSEGFGAFKKILSDEAKPGIYPMGSPEVFPQPDRTQFYNQYPQHAKSKIKSFITMTGCPYTCTYCYNSSTPKDIKDITPELAQQMALSMKGGRLFPTNIRSVEDVVAEGREIAEKWPTEVMYCQDDVHGFNVHTWMPQFAAAWRSQVGIPYHAQMRYEMTRDEKRLDELVKAGCFGLTLAIEAADPHVRKEVLDRGMEDDVVFSGMKALTSRGFKIRTEQITALPYGATSKPTPMNLTADLGLVELNVRLRKETGGPDMAWGSTLAPYQGTKLGAYCEDYGHYVGNTNDVPDTFFDKSVLRFPKEWIGPSLKERKNDPSVWLNQDELDLYRSQNAELRRIFNFVTQVPEGHKLAEQYLTSSQPYTYERLGRETEQFLRTMESSDSSAARPLLDNIEYIRSLAPTLTENPEGKKIVTELAGYFGCLPKPELAAQRFVRYAEKKGGYTPKVLSNATRHHLYDEVLYCTKDNPRLEESKRFISKV